MQGHQATDATLDGIVFGAVLTRCNAILMASSLVAIVLGSLEIMMNSWVPMVIGAMVFDHSSPID